MKCVDKDSGRVKVGSVDRGTVYPSQLFSSQDRPLNGGNTS